MKLRNKKTGKVTSDYSYILLESTHYKTYNSLAELNADWEDYDEQSEKEAIAMLKQIAKALDKIKANISGISGLCGEEEE